MPRHNKRVDANHAEIKAALKAAGWEVIDYHSAGYGIPDLLVYHGKVGVWVECKMPGKKLTKAEAEFFKKAPGKKVIVYGSEDVVTKLKIWEACPW